MLESSGPCKYTFLKVRKDSIKLEGMHDIVPLLQKIR